jgi:hypothetical protein
MHRYREFPPPSFVSPLRLFVTTESCIHTGLQWHGWMVSVISELSWTLDTTLVCKMGAACHLQQCPDPGNAMDSWDIDWTYASCLYPSIVLILWWTPHPGFRVPQDGRADGFKITVENTSLFDSMELEIVGSKNAPPASARKLEDSYRIRYTLNGADCCGETARNAQ